jgi:site-specific recombinase XerD
VTNIGKDVASMTYNDERTPFELFCDDLKLLNLSDGTKKEYEKSVSAFLSRASKPQDEVDWRDARNHLLTLVDRGLAARTVNAHGAAIMCFFRVTLRTPITRSDLPLQKVDRIMPPAVDRKSISAILDACESKRDKALVLLGYGAGLRAGEAVALRIRDIRTTEGRIYVMKQKNRADRYTLLPQAALPLLRDIYRDLVRSGDPHGPDDPFFRSRGRSGRLTPESANNILKKAAERAGAGRDYTYHALRHGFATVLFEDGVTLPAIKELLGHRSIQSTTVYIRIANATGGLTSPADRL